MTPSSRDVRGNGRERAEGGGWRKVNDVFSRGCVCVTGAVIRRVWTRQKGDVFLDKVLFIVD